MSTVSMPTWISSSMPSLLKVDLDAIRAAGHPTATAIIVTDGAGDEVKMLAEGDVAPGTPLFKV